MVRLLPIFFGNSGIGAIVQSADIAKDGMDIFAIQQVPDVDEKFLLQLCRQRLRLGPRRRGEVDRSRRIAQINPPIEHVEIRNLDQFIFYGGYPGAAALISDHERRSNSILNALIQTTISRDILFMMRVDKPVLLKRLIELGCACSGQIVSYQKMIGQLQDAGNTTTLVHYLDVLESAGLVAGLNK